MGIQFTPKLKKIIFQTLISNLLLSIFFIIIAIAIVLIPQINSLFSLIPLTLILIIIIPSIIISIGNAKNTTYYIDEDKITYHRKFISEDQIDIPQAQITNIDYTISWFLDKIFKTGTIKVYTAGTSFTDMHITNISNIEERYQKINAILGLKKSKNNIDESTEETKSKLLKKIQPDAGVATLASSISLIIMAFFTMGISLIFTFFIPIIIYKAYKKKNITFILTS
jgi:uncharacterized membrane protein YdbT with pleckstrin-like domain